MTGAQVRVKTSDDHIRMAKSTNRVVFNKYVRDIITKLSIQIRYLRIFLLINLKALENYRSVLEDKLVIVGKDSQAAE